MLDLGRSRPLPVAIEAAGIPFLRQFPARLDRHEVAFGRTPPLQPPVEMILRPEGEDRRSGEADVFPEPDGRDHEVHDPIRIHRPARADREREPFAALSTPARGVCHGIPAENGGDAEDVPDSVAPVALRPDQRHAVRR